MTEKYKRQCPDWLTTFGEWTLVRSEAPQSYIFWTGVFTLTSALRRRVHIPKELLGSWSCYPNMYILFVADAGMRKTTTANYSDDLLQFVPGLASSPDIVTREALLDKLVKSEDNSMYILAGEFGEFITKSGLEMYSFLTNAYDGKRQLHAATISRGAEVAQSPCVNMLGATTPAWIAANMPESVIGGGFASRVIFIHEDKLRQRKLFHTDVDYTKLTILQTKLIADLKHIALNLTGRFSIESKATEHYVEDWYKSQVDDKKSSTHKMSGYFERKPAHVLKLAQVLRLSCSDELVLTKEDFDKAIKIIDMNEKTLPRVFSGVGKNQYVADIHRIHAFVLETPNCTRALIHETFMYVATPKLLDELIEGLIAAQAIKPSTKNGTTYLITC